MDFKILKEKALNAGLTNIEMTLVSSEELSFSTFDDTIDQRSEHDSSKAIIRGVYNNQISTVSTEDLSDENIDYVIETLKASSEVLDNKDPFFIYEGSESYETLPEYKSDLNNYTTEEKIDLLLRAYNYCKAHDNNFFHFQAEYGEVTSKISMKNSKGLDLSREVKYSVIVFALVSKVNDDMKDEYTFKYIKNLSDFNLEEELDKLIAKVNDKFAAQTVLSNKYKVVLDSDVVCDLLSVYSSIFSAKAVIRKLSFLEGKLGEKVFGDNVTIYDDPFLAEAPIMYNFDDEGVATKKTSLVENGKLLTYLHNLQTAAMLNTTSTGNGYNNGVNCSTLVLCPGDKTKERLYEEVGNGILITSITGLHAGVNQVSGDFNVQCSGYLIENGKKTTYVTLMVLSGKFQDVFNNIVSIANDSTYNSSCFCPSVFVKEMNISGK